MADLLAVEPAKAQVNVESHEVESNDWDEKTFFPFQSVEERQQIRVNQHTASFPKLGVGALTGALSLIVLSAAILLIIQGPGKVVSDWTIHVYKTHRHITIPKPAAWLSVILSGLSVCFHIALSEGLNVAWWYHVRQSNVTVRDLHNVWNHGTSTWFSVKTGVRDIKDSVSHLKRKVLPSKTDPEAQRYSKQRRFSYMALATLFTATVPLNGFLLQNAVIVVLTATTQNATMIVPMLNADNFQTVEQVSALPDGAGGVSGWSSTLGQLSQIITSKTDASVDLGLFDTTCLDSCRTTVEGMGFQIQCEDSSEPYDLPYIADQDDLDEFNSTAGVANGTDLVTLGITFDRQNASTITLRTMWKGDSACNSSSYSIQTCKLDLATVKYPIIINSHAQEVSRSGVSNTTIMTLNMDLLTQTPDVVKVVPNPAITSTDVGYAVAGLAGLYAQTLNASINLRYDTSLSYYADVWTAQGMFGQQQLSTSTTLSQAYPACLGYSSNITQQALAIIHSMTFQMGAYNWLTSFGNTTDQEYNIGSIPENQTLAEFVEDNTPRLVAEQTYQRNEYRVVWAWYFGAVTVTTVVALFILPTFWGYWRLERKTTMSPFETARAFHAPGLYQQDSSIVTDDLIRRVGNMNVHRDLPIFPTQLEPPGGRSPQTS